MRTHLTDVTVQRLRKPGTYWDETTPGFGIRVGKKRKTWVIMRGQVRQRVRIGHYPAVSLAAARSDAKKLLTEAPTRNPAITVETAYDEYKETLTAKKPRTQAEYKRHMAKHFTPRVGKKRLAELQYEHLMECVSGLPPGEAAHALTVCRAFLRWCVRPPRRYIPHSPLEGVEIKPPKKRKRILAEDEIRTVWNAALAQSYPHGTICRLLLATGQRRSEIAHLRRPWINEKEQTMTLPDWLTKNSKEHTFPYNGVVAAILQEIPRRNDTDFLFPSRYSGERPISGWSKYKKELNELAAGTAPWRLHDLRRTYRSVHGQIGTSREIAERLINHASGVQTDVEAIYDRWTYLPQMRSAVEAFETHLQALLARAA